MCLGATRPMGNSISQTTHCPYCALQCGMHLAGTPDAVTIAGNPRFPVNKGGLCVKGWSAAGTLAHPERLTTPLVRDAAGTLQPATWDAALAFIAERVRATQSAHGKDAVGVFGSGALTSSCCVLRQMATRLARCCRCCSWIRPRASCRS